MHSSKQVVYSEVGHEDGEEGESDVDVEDAVGAQPRNRCVVKGDAVNYHSDERPNFFRVPTPVISPRYVSPNGSDKYADGEQECGWVEHDAADDGESLRLFLS